MRRFIFALIAAASGLFFTHPLSQGVARAATVDAPSSPFHGAQGGNSAAAPPGEPGAWRLIHTPGVNGGPDSAAILRVADFEKSDARLAGLMLRCGKKGVETIIVVVEPFSPQQAHPKITLRVGGDEFYFDGKVISTGAGLIIPGDGMQFAFGPWRGSNELFIKVSDGDSEMSGVVELAGLTTAIQHLAECALK